MHTQSIICLTRGQHQLCIAMKLPILTSSLLALSAVLSPAADKPNIVFIMADDMAWADVGFNGHKFFETPNIDKLSKDGTLLNQMYAGGPNCAPTRACLVTGMYTPRHHIYQPGAMCKGDKSKMRLVVPGSCDEGKSAFPSLTSLKPEVTSIAEVLKTAGYTSGRFGKWHLGEDTQGFDVSTSDGRDGPNNKHYGSKTVADTITDAAIDFMKVKVKEKKPFFVYLTHWDVHGPIRAKSSLVDKYKAKNTKLGTSFNPIYAGMMEQVDTSVKRMREAVESLGIAKNTIIIFTSDNGGANYTDNKPLKSAKGALHEGGIRVPSCVYWKGKTIAGKTVDTVITSVDMLPTFAELAGAKLPTNQPVDGTSVTSALTGAPKQELAHRAVFWHYPHYLVGTKGKSRVIPPFGSTVGYFRGTPSTAMREGDWKMIYFIESDQAELYNIAKDPYEKKDLRESNPAKYKEMISTLKSWQKNTHAPVPTKINPLFGKPEVKKENNKKGKKNKAVKRK